MSRHAVFAAALAASLSMPALKAHAQADFYKGKTVLVDIGADVGGGFDAYGRVIAEFIGRHIPGNPTVSPQNRPGAGGRVSANWLYNVAPKDGTGCGTELAYWMGNAPWKRIEHPPPTPKPTKPVKPPAPLTLASLPAECRAVVAAQ